MPIDHSSKYSPPNQTPTEGGTGGAQTRSHQLMGSDHSGFRQASNGAHGHILPRVRHSSVQRRKTLHSFLRSQMPFPETVQAIFLPLSQCGAGHRHSQKESWEWRLGQSWLRPGALPRVRSALWAHLGCLGCSQHQEGREAGICSTSQTTGFPQRRTAWPLGRPTQVGNPAEAGCFTLDTGESLAASETRFHSGKPCIVLGRRYRVSTVLSRASSWAPTCLRPEDDLGTPG